jgi:toxin-antitoxin system PIN domain toxin
MLTADTNLFIHATDPDSVFHDSAKRFFHWVSSEADNFVVCELVLVEIFILLRNPAVFKKPYTAKEAAGYCRALKSNPEWRCIDYDAAVSAKLWEHASKSKAGYRHIIDARLALTLRHHGVNEFATVNTKHFEDFGFQKVWNPLDEIGGRIAHD